MTTAKLKKKILIISHDKIGKNMAGPGIRYHHMAEFLSRTFDVTVGFFDPTYLPDESFERTYDVTHVDVSTFQSSFSDKDAVIAMLITEEMMRYCKEHNIYIAFDIYGPVPVENLALFMYSGNPVTTDTDYDYRQSYNLYEKFFQYGDLFLLSNRRQLDFWMGYVFGTGIINVSNYLARLVFDRFIYAPMGIDTASKPKHTKSVLRGVLPGVKESDKVLLWTGGIWNWFDAQTLIKVMKRLSDERPDIKLVFFGTKHPNPDVPAMQEAAAALQLATELDLLNKTVFVHEGWVPYGDRINYLLEADVAVNTTKETIESELAHRTRVLDHLLAVLPTIATTGDYLSDEVIVQQDIGITVPPADEAALYDAILSAVDDQNNKRFRENIEKIRHNYDWSETLAPLNDALQNNMTKLPFVSVKKPREMRKDQFTYKLAKKILPRSVKSIIIKVLRYGR